MYSFEKSIFLLFGIAVFAPVVMVHGGRNEMGTPATAFSAGKKRADSAKVEISDDQIRKLILNLGNSDFRVRENSMKRLEVIGERALDELREAETREDPEIHRRSRLLINRIESRLSVQTVNGMQFKPLMDKEWMVPKQGERTTIHIALETKNLSKKVRRLQLGIAYLSVVVEDTSGRELSPFSIYGKSLGGTSLVLPPKQTYRMQQNGMLVHSGDGIFFCEGEGMVGPVWKLSRGIYFISLIYEMVPCSREEFWHGKLQTTKYRITIK